MDTFCGFICKSRLRGHVRRSQLPFLWASANVGRGIFIRSAHPRSRVAFSARPNTGLPIEWLEEIGVDAGCINTSTMLAMATNEFLAAIRGPRDLLVDDVIFFQ